MSLSIFTNWAVGAINGYKQKENGLPNGIKYGTLGLSTLVGMAKVLGTEFSQSVRPAHKLAAGFIAMPVIVGTTFCLGHHLGKAVCYAEDTPYKSKSIITNPIHPLSSTNI
jgi:hypothetical protein